MGVSPLNVAGTNYTSDQRLKEDIETASPADCKAIFDAVEVKTFQWKRDGQRSVGFIAQEVEAALPTNGKFDDIVNQCTYQPTEEDEPLEKKVLDYSRMAAVFLGRCEAT